MMATKTKIEWADITINPIIGCTKCSPGCDHCFAETMATRLAKMPETANRYSLVITDGRWNGRIDVNLRKVGILPISGKSRRIFVGSMGDVFHENVSSDDQIALFRIFEIYHMHTFMLLTKRPDQMRAFINGIAWGMKDAEKAGMETLFREWPLPNVWLGITAENQEMADKRIPILLSTPAAKRFVSIEPMLGPVDLWCTGSLTPDTRYGLDWVITGGESGRSSRRPLHPKWVRSVRDQCQSAGVPFMFKQWGEWVTENQAPDDIVLPGESWVPKGWRGKKYEDSVFRVGKKAAGCLLDGREWKEFPE